MLISVTCFSVSAVDFDNLSYDCAVHYNASSVGAFDFAHGRFTASSVTGLYELDFTFGILPAFASDSVVYSCANIWFEGPTSTNPYSLVCDAVSASVLHSSSTIVEPIFPAVPGAPKVHAKTAVYRVSSFMSAAELVKNGSQVYTLQGFVPRFEGASSTAQATLYIDSVSFVYFESYSTLEIVQGILDKLIDQYRLLQEYYPQFLKLANDIFTSTQSIQKTVSKIRSMLADTNIYLSSINDYTMRTYNLVKEYIESFSQVDKQPLDDSTNSNKNNMQIIDDFESTKRDEAKQSIDTIFNGVGSLSDFSSAFSLIGGMFGLCWNGLGSLYVVVFLPLVFALAGVLIGRAEHTARSSRRKDDNSGGDI